MDYKQILSDELARRQSRNAGYSLRAYAGSLGVSVTTLSEVLNGKRRLRQDSVTKIADRLSLAPEVRSEFALSALGFELKAGHPAPDSATSSFQEFDLDRFKLVSDWYHIAILSLGKLRHNRADPSWIAQRLGISHSEATQGFSRLRRLELLDVVGKRFVRTTKPLFVNAAGVSSAAVRKYHRQNLEKAIDSLDQDPVEVRDFSSITMAVVPDKLPAARKKIQEFREQLAAFMENGEKQEIYTLAVQFFPVSKAEVR